MNEITNDPLNNALCRPRRDCRECGRTFTYNHKPDCWTGLLEQLVDAQAAELKTTDRVIHDRLRAEIARWQSDGVVLKAYTDEPAALNAQLRMLLIEASGFIKLLGRNNLTAVDNILSRIEAVTS